MSVNGFLVDNAVQKYNYESLENYNTPDFSTSSTYQVGDYAMYQGKLYKCTTAITTGGVWDSTKWSLAILSDDVADLNGKLDEIDEVIDFVTMTSGIENEVINGVTVNSESDGTLKLYGTSTAPRRFLCLNGQKFTAASSFSFRQTLDAGTYEISAYVSGYATTLYWDYTYTTFASSVRLITTGNAPVKVTFTAPVMIGLYMATNGNFGTVDNPTYVKLRATKLTANDLIARANASATAESLLKTISASNITLTESNYLTYFPNGSFNDAPLNSIFGISINVPLTDGPDGDSWIGYGSHTSTGYNRGILMTFRQYGVNDTLYSGITQMLIGYRENSNGYKPTFSYRTAIVSGGAYVWSDWSKFEENGYLHSGNRVISAGRMSESVSNLNDMPPNVIYQIDRNCDGSDADHTLLNHPCPGVSCIVSTMAFSYSTKHGMAQTVYALNGNIYWRYGYQDSADDYRFTEWKQIVTYIPDPPTTDGVYVLKCEVTNGTPEYNYESSDDATKLKSALRLEQEINETEITLALDDYEIKRRVITPQNGWSTPASTSPSRSSIVRIPEGCTKMLISTDGVNSAVFAFLSSDTGYSDSSGLPPQFSVEYPGRIMEPTATEKVYDVYSDVKFIYFLVYDSSGNDLTPGVKFYIDAKESIGFILNNKTAVLAEGVVSNVSITSDGGWATSSSPFQSSCVRVPFGTKTVQVTGKSGTIIGFLKSLENRRTADGASVSFATGYAERIVFSNEETKKFVIGADCEWIYTNTTTRAGEDVAPVIVFNPDILRSEDVPNIEEYTNGKFFDILPTLYEGWFNWKLHFSYLASGSTNSADGFATTEPIPVVPGNQIVNVSAAADDNDNLVSFYIVEFDGDTFIRRYSFANGSEYVVPSGVNYIRFMFGFAASYNISITKPMLSKYFAVKFLSTAAQNDFETPVYVAYGASTTIGAVHRFTGQGTYYSAYSFPDYIGRALNLKTYNHGHGTTGFLARADGNTPNFMDAIYADDNLLKTASLVTIIFGYGNDHSAGLPIGLYDDYYPYDEEGYHPSGSAGVAEMLSKGATLMGCLNWCIKWISEHYPKINLVILFGSPSDNEDRTVSKIENPDTTSGRPPYKLTFVDPYPDPGTYNPYALPSSAGGATQIRIEYPKLKKALNMPFIDLSNEGIPINYYNATAKDEDGKYAIFSTTGTADDETTWAWNSHPNDAGYKLYAQYIAGRVIALYKH